jgi:hypothetical protein
MAWGEKRTRDHKTMFAVHYDDGRTAYIRVSAKQIELVPAIAREMQAKGEIPEGKIKTVKRVR